MKKHVWIRLERKKENNLHYSLAGVTVGDPVLRTGKPLSVELGPGIMTSIFDGKLSFFLPQMYNSIFFRYSTTFGSHLWSYEKYLYSSWYQCTCIRSFKIMGICTWQSYSSKMRCSRKSKSIWYDQVGSHVTGGDIFGTVPENRMIKHRIMLHPKAKGTVTYIAPGGNYTLDVCWLNLIWIIFENWIGCCSWNWIRWRKKQTYNASNLASATNATSSWETCC